MSVVKGLELMLSAYSGENHISNYKDKNVNDLLDTILDMKLTKNEVKVLSLYAKMYEKAFQYPRKFCNNRGDNLFKIVKLALREGLAYPLLSLKYKLSLADERFSQIEQENSYVALMVLDLTDSILYYGYKNKSIVVGYDESGTDFLLTNLSSVEHYFEMNYYFKSTKIDREFISTANSVVEMETSTYNKNTSLITRLAHAITNKHLKLFGEKWLPLYCVHSSQMNSEYYPARTTQYYFRKLKKRKYILDRSVVEVLLPNDCPIRKLRLVEVLTRGKKPFLLFAYEMYGIEGFRLGYYDIKRGKMEVGLDTPKTEDDVPSEIVASVDSIYNIILEIYYVLTADRDEEEEELANRPFAYITTSKDYDFDGEVSLNLENGIPILCYPLYSMEEDREESHESVKGSPKSPHVRIHTTRKLPDGWQRSKEAEDLAKLYGVKLKDGETFVSEAYIHSSKLRNVRDDWEEN